MLPTLCYQGRNVRPSRYDLAGYDGERIKPSTMLLLPDELYANKYSRVGLRADVAAWLRENDIMWQQVDVPVAIFYKGATPETEGGIWFPNSPNNALLFKMRWS